MKYESISCELKPGDVLIFNHRVVHGSSSNHSSKSRKAIVVQARKNIREKDMNVFQKETDYRTNFVIDALQKRIDKYGTDLHWNYLTVDWYAKYSDYIKASSMPAVDADKNYQSMMGIRDLRDRAVLRKIMSVR